MKRLMLVFSIVLVIAPASLWAQTVPKADFFGGFSVLHISADDGDFKLTPIGWQAAIAGNINSRFAIVGDFGGQYKDSTDCPSCKTFSYLGGVRVNHRVERATVFAHALYGGLRFSGGGESENRFTMGYGGGVDVRANDKVSIRVIQFDWLPSKNTGGDSGWETNLTRYGFGVVFNIGSR